MEADDTVCVCHKVTLRKLVHFLEREQPTVPSQLSECLGAGTGCQWCVPYLEKLHAQWKAGQVPHVDDPVAQYTEARAAYKEARRAAKAQNQPPAG